MAVSYDFGPGMGQSLNLIGQSLSKSFPDQDTRNARERRELQLENAQHQATQIRIHEASINAMMPVMEEQAAFLAQGISNALTVGDYGTAFLRTASALKLFSGGEESDPFAKFRADLMSRGNGPQIFAQFQGFHQTVMSQKLKIIDESKSVLGDPVYKKEEDGVTDLTVMVQDAIDTGKADDSISNAMYAKTTAPESKIKIAELFDKDIDPNNPNRLMGREETDRTRTFAAATLQREQEDEFMRQGLSRGMQAAGKSKAYSDATAQQIVDLYQDPKEAAMAETYNYMNQWKPLGEGEVMGPAHIKKLKQNENLLDRKLHKEQEGYGGITTSPELRLERLKIMNEASGLGWVGDDSSSDPKVRNARKAALFSNEAERAFFSSSASEIDGIELQLMSDYHAGKRKTPPTQKDIYDKYYEKIGPEKTAEVKRYFELMDEKRNITAVSNPDHPIYDVKGWVNVSTAMSNISDWKAKHEAEGTYRFLTAEQVKEEIGLNLLPVQVDEFLQQYVDNHKGQNLLTHKPGGTRILNHLTGADAIQNAKFSGLLDKVDDEHKERAQHLLFGRTGTPLTNPSSHQIENLTDLAFSGAGQLSKAIGTMVGMVSLQVAREFDPHIQMANNLFAMELINRRSPDALKEIGLHDYFMELRTSIKSLIPLEEDKRGMKKTMEGLASRQKAVNAELSGLAGQTHIDDAIPHPTWRQDDKLANTGGADFLKYNSQLAVANSRAQGKIDHAATQGLIEMVGGDDPSRAQFALDALIRSDPQRFPPGTTLARDPSTGQVGIKTP